MNKLLLLVAVLIALPVLATDELNQTLSLSSGSSVASTVLGSGNKYALQCDGEVRWISCPTSTCTALTTSSRITNFDVPVDLDIPPRHLYIAAIRTGSSTVTCYLYTVSK